LIPRPWAMSPAQIVSAEEAIRELVGADVALLLEPRLLPEHAPLVESIRRLPWEARPLGIVAAEAVGMLAAATRLGGPVDPALDDSDVPWALAMNRIGSDPAAGSKSARRWFAGVESLLWEGVEVSPVAMAVAAYYAAHFEDRLGHDHECWWWMQMATAQAEIDGRAGLGVVAVLRSARLLVLDLAAVERAAT
jgi:hypothetical protein